MQFIYLKESRRLINLDHVIYVDYARDADGVPFVTMVLTAIGQGHLYDTDVLGPLEQQMVRCTGRDAEHVLAMLMPDGL